MSILPGTRPIISELGRIIALWEPTEEHETSLIDIRHLPVSPRLVGFIANVENRKIIKLSVLPLFHKTESLGPYQRMHVTNVLID